MIVIALRYGTDSREKNLPLMAEC